MSDFTFIAQKQMGQLRPKDRRSLLQMEKKYFKLVEELHALETERDALLVRVGDDLKIDTTGPFRGMSVEEDGRVIVTYCPCVTCQAQLNNVTVSEAAEAMLAQGLVHGNDAAHLRAFAASADTKRGKVFVN